MDFPVSPVHDQESVGVEAWETSSRRPDYFAASSLNTASFELDHTIHNDRDEFTLREQYFASNQPPPPLQGASYEMDDFREPSKPRQISRAPLRGEITPYLGLRARLTQVPINRWTVLLFLVLARMILLFEGLNTDFTSAQQEATTACSKVEDIGSTLASMPHYLSQGVNELIADGITNVVRGLISVLMLVLTGVEEIIFWFIELIMNGVLVCLFSELIEGLLTLLQVAVGDVVDAINAIMKPIMADVGTLVDGAAGAIGDVENFIKGVVGIFETPPKMPDLSGIKTEMNKLSNATDIDPSTILHGISDIQGAVNFSSLQRDVQFVIDLPFEIIKTLLNESYGNWTMDSSVFPIVNRESLTFCTGNDTLTDFFEIIFTILKNAKVIASIGLVILAILAVVFMAWWEVKRYRRTVVRSETLRDREPMDAVYVAGRPLTAGAGLWASEKFSQDPERQMLVRWCIAYSTSFTALFLLSLAVAGAFSVLCQFVVMWAIQKEVPSLATEVGDFVSNVVGTLEGTSAKWANESNSAVMDVQDGINNHVLGYAKNATGAISNALSLFENKTQDVLKETFGDTELYTFIDGVVGCILLDRLDEARRGLAWVHDHAQVSFPTFPANVFSLGVNDTAGGGNNSNSSLAGLLASSGSDTADEITGAVARVVAAMRSSMAQEGLIALVLLLVYLLYVTLAAAQAVLRMCCLRDRATKQQQELFAHEGQMGGGDAQPRRYTTGAESTANKMPRSVTPSGFSDFDIARAQDDRNETSAAEIVARSSAAGAPSTRKEALVHVEVLSMPGENPFRDEALPVEENRDGDVVHALHGGSQCVVDVDVAGLAPRRAHFWAEDGHV